MKTVFFGSSEFSAVVLQDLVEHAKDTHIHIAAVVTKKDAPIGRKQVITPTIVKQYALLHGIPVIHKLDDAKSYIEENNIDVAITASYGKILKKDILDAPQYGFVNVHPSLIPDLRGAIPIQMALFKGYMTSGVSIITMEEGMDTGDILTQEPFLIKPEDTFGSLSISMAHVGAALLQKVLPSYVAGTLALQKQDDAKATFCYLKDIDRIENVTYITDDAFTIMHAVHALSPSTAITIELAGYHIGLYEVEAIADIPEIAHEQRGKIGIYAHDGQKDLYLLCKENTLILKKIKPQGKNIMRGIDFYNGHKEKLKEIIL